MSEHKTAGPLGQLSTAALRARRRRRAQRVLDLNLVLSGSLVTQSRRCGKAGCRCVTGDGHGPYTYLSSAGDGAARLRYVPKEQVEAVTRRLSATAALQRLLAEISAINAELLARRELD
jgi:Family of unknown function (DUF6788)